MASITLWFLITFTTHEGRLSNREEAREFAWLSTDDTLSWVSAISWEDY